MTNIDVNALKAIMKNHSRQLLSPITVLVGKPGVGKTHLAVSAQQHLGDTLLLDTEDGGHQYDIPRIAIDSSKTMKDVLSALHQQDDICKVLIIDTLGELNKIFTKEILREYTTRDCTPKSLDDPNCGAFGYGKGWSLLTQKWDLFIDTLKLLRKKHRIAVFMTSHSKFEKCDLKDGYGSFDQQDLDLPVKCANIIKRAVDNIYVLNNDVCKSGNRQHRTERNLTVATHPSLVSKGRVPLAREMYEITGDKNIAAFWADFKKAWYPENLVAVVTSQPGQVVEEVAYAG